MTYYLLPKTNHPFSIKITIQNEPLLTYTSHSLFFFYHKITKQFIHLFTTLQTSSIHEYSTDFFKDMKNPVFSEPLDQDTLNYLKMEFISKIFHPYEYLSSNVFVTKLQIQNQNQKKNFYDFYEIVKTVYLFENFHKKNIMILTISPNPESIQECIEFVRDGKKDEIFSFESYTYFFREKEEEKEKEEKEEKEKEKEEKTFDFIFYELDKEKYQNDNEYIIGLIQIVIILLKTQKQGSSCMIKINGIFLKPILDIIYLLTSLYEKTYIMKPSVSNVVTFEKYLICKNFIDDSLSFSQRDLYYEKFVYYLKKFQEYRAKKTVYISSIIESSLPCYFISKINDINIIIGQQQLEAIQQMIVFFKNKNKEKMNQMTKMHIYKSIKWCEKFKIPHHIGF